MSDRGQGMFEDLSIEQQVFLIFMKIRCNFDNLHLSTMFAIPARHVSQLLHNWINYMYFTFMKIKTWPHRDVLHSVTA